MEAENRGPQVTGVTTFFLLLSTLTILARCYCRTFVIRGFGLDDWAAIVAWVFFTLFCSFAYAGVAHGTGQHAWNIKPASEIPIGLKWWWACEPMYVLGNMALKFSIAIMLLRIAASKIHKIIIWATLIVLELYSGFYFFLFVLQCRPSAYFWTQYTGGKGTCIDPRITVDATYGYSAISCGVDWTLAIMPIFIIWNLQMNSRTKISVALILAMGATASTATIVRIPYIQTLEDQADFLYATTDVAIWSILETGLGITASCLATLRPLFREFFSRSKLFGGSSSHVITGGRYVRSESIGIEEIGLRDGCCKNAGTTTTIQSDLAYAPDMDGIRVTHENWVDRNA
ncbi:hypothetical protein LSUE1_G007941 [Lachnellula suecica]|uniref:Rhodopsin domain-containing protein n=1 Tax=Lachnellula suecica TaxID=602035 RepID=A0A8T9BXJ0_9HELO|nr:hypothetical protein LSUE1_G007941 [Lachnellula suecica]